MDRFSSLRTPAGRDGAVEVAGCTGARLSDARLCTISGSGGIADAQPPVIHIARHGSLPVLTDASRGAPLLTSNCRIISPWLASRPVGRHPGGTATDIAQPGNISTPCRFSPPVGCQPGWARLKPLHRTWAAEGWDGRWVAWEMGARRGVRGVMGGFGRGRR